MGTARRLPALLLLFVLASSPVAGAPAVDFFGRDLAPLVSLVSMVSADYSAHWTKRQVYIFRDGTVLVTALAEGFERPLPTLGYVRSGKAPIGLMQQLAAALGQAHVAQLTDCFLDPEDAPFDWEYLVTWYGKGDRRNTFRITDGGLPECSLKVAELRDAIESVVFSATQAATTRLQTP